MSTITVKVPYSENVQSRSGWCENISQYIDAGNDVVFVDQNSGDKVEVSRVQLDAAGSISVYGKGYTSANAKKMALVAGGFHNIGGIYGFVAADTTTSAGIHVKI